MSDSDAEPSLTLHEHLPTVLAERRSRRGRHDHTGDWGLGRSLRSTSVALPGTLLENNGLYPRSVAKNADEMDQGASESWRLLRLWPILPPSKTHVQDDNPRNWGSARSLFRRRQSLRRSRVCESGCIPIPHRLRPGSD